MLTTAARSPGHPGVFLAPAKEDAALRPERLDITGFVGVALRGPVDEPVRVERWSEYERIFGGFEAPPGGPRRMLPHAVATFFRQGGRVAYVVRIAPHDGGPSGLEATTQFRMPLARGDEALLSAADEGEWGNRLTVWLTYRVSQRLRAVVRGDGALLLPPGADVPVGSLLRVSAAEAGSDAAMRWVTAVDESSAPGACRPVRLDAEAAAGAARVEVVTGELRIDDPAATSGGETLTGLGLRWGHPRWIHSVLAERGAARGGASEAPAHLVVPVGDWSAVDFTPGRELAPIAAGVTQPGEDRSHLIDDTAFFDPGHVDFHTIDEELHPVDPNPHVGIDRMARVREIGLLCVPDITWATYSPAPPPPVRHPLAPLFCRCAACAGAVAAEPEYHAVSPAAGGLDATLSEEFEILAVRQERTVELARACGRFIALLDVPDRLPLTRIAEWRARFDTAYAAAYHPWLAVSADGDGSAIPLPPSSFAAGIIAERELRLGLPWGPANELAAGAVRMESIVTDAVHDTLHGLGINVYRAERDGFRLSAARTLSTDPEYRQMSVRRLMTMLRLTLQRQCADLAFEPNTPELRQRLKYMITALLRDLARKGAFAGRTEAESFFVRCGDDLNTRGSQALGRLTAEIGVAPAVPIEFILVRIARDPDGSLTVVRDGE